MTRRDIPNLITLLRLLLLAPLVYFLWQQQFAAALFIFALAGSSDALDGFLARRYGWGTPLGAILDPLADKLLMATSYCMLGWLDLIPLWIVALVLGRDLIIIGGALAYSRLVERPEMAPSRISKLNTVAQILFVVSVLISLSGMILPNLWIWGLAGVMVLTTLWSGADYVWRWGNKALDEHKEQP